MQMIPAADSTFDCTGNTVMCQALETHRRGCGMSIFIDVAEFRTEIGERISAMIWRPSS